MLGTYIWMNLGKNCRHSEIVMLYTQIVELKMIFLGNVHTTQWQSLCSVVFWCNLIWWSNNLTDNNNNNTDLPDGLSLLNASNIVNIYIYIFLTHMHIEETRTQHEQMSKHVHNNNDHVTTEMFNPSMIIGNWVMIQQNNRLVLNKKFHEELYRWTLVVMFQIKGRHEKKIEKIYKINIWFEKAPNFGKNFQSPKKTMCENKLRIGHI